MNNAAVDNARVVCYRGLLEQITSAMVVTRTGPTDGWRIVSQYYGGVIFLCEFMTPNSTSFVKPEKLAADLLYENKAAYWTHKFRACMTTLDKGNVGEVN